MSVKAKIKKVYKEQQFCSITKTIEDGSEVSTNGYIVDYSKGFVVQQEVEDFRPLGFMIIPTDRIVDIRSNNNSKYYDQIMIWEHEKEKIGTKTKFNLKSWKAILKTFQKKGRCVVVECEGLELIAFNIGEITRITDKAVYIFHFLPNGFWEEAPTKVKFKNITQVMFDNRYIDIFSKYTRKRKDETKKKKPK